MVLVDSHEQKVLLKMLMNSIAATYGNTKVAKWQLISTVMHFFSWKEEQIGKDINDLDNQYLVRDEQDYLEKSI